MSISQDDEWDLGRPSQRLRPQQVATPVTASATQHDASEELLGGSGTRAGDLNWNRPRQAPVKTVRHVSAAELEALDRQAAKRRFEEELDNELTTSLVALPDILTTPFASLALLLVAGMLGLFALAQVTATLVALAALPLWIRMACYGLFACFLLMTLGATIRFTMLYWRLHTNRQIPLKGLQKLSERRHLRFLVEERLGEAQGAIASFLQEYPLEQAPRHLLRAGLTASDLDGLARARARLLDKDRYAGAEAWLEDFRRDFQHLLDEAARRKIKHHARHVAVKTAASPYPLMDVLIAAAAHLQLLTQLCTLYNLRMGWTATLVTLGRIFFSSYLAGQIDNAEDYVADQVSVLFDEGGLETLILSKFASKAAAGLFNYKLMTRVGYASVRLLQPVAVQS